MFVSEIIGGILHRDRDRVHGFRELGKISVTIVGLLHQEEYNRDLERPEG